MSEGRAGSACENWGSGIGDLTSSTAGMFCPFGIASERSLVLTGPDFSFVLSRLVLSSDVSSMPSKAAFLFEPEEDLLECSSMCWVNELSSICSH